MSYPPVAVAAVRRGASIMSSRSWFFASEGKQHGPYPETDIRAFAAGGTIRADTLVWTEGMPNWQKAVEIPGLLGGPPTQPGSAPPSIDALPAAAAGGNGQQLVADFGIWALLGYALLYGIGLALVIPAPWTATGFYGWLLERIRVPQRPALGFTGKPGDIWYVFVLMGLLSYAGVGDNPWPVLVSLVLQPFLAWMTLRWVTANVTSAGQKLPLSFSGSPWAYLGWNLLLFISTITIIGWAWVMTAWIRWICLNLDGTRRAVVFNGSGLGVLWRTLVFVLGVAFIIPIPWVLAWYTRWFVSQFALVPRGSVA
jgi:hypothetical protein